MSKIISTWAVGPIDIEDGLSSEAWADAGTLDIPNGKLYVKNDDKFLYVAMDMTSDTGNNAGTGDYFWFTFDRDRNKSITPNVDVNYGLYPGQPNKMGRTYYVRPGATTGLVNETSDSIARAGFEISPEMNTAHRVWKMRFVLADLNVSLNTRHLPYTRFGVRVKSSVPNFTSETPTGFLNDFTKLNILYFARKPSYPNGTVGNVFGGVGLIPFTKINARTGRATTDAGYAPFVQNAAFGSSVNVIGNRVTLAQLFRAGARRYAVFHREGFSGDFDEQVLSNWKNYKWTGTTYELLSFGPDEQGRYPMLDSGADYSIDDLLIRFNTNAYTAGVHQFKVVFYRSNGTEVAVAEERLTLDIDNNLPNVNIDAILHNNQQVSACSIVNLKDSNDGLRFRITAHDPEGNLRGLALSAHWGDNQSETIHSESYTTSRGNWQGVQNLLVPASEEWVPDVTCAYQFKVGATARTTNGYSYIGYTTYSKHLTLIKPGNTLLGGGFGRIVFPIGGGI